MSKITNYAPGPRVVNAKDGRQITIDPGMSAIVDVQDDKHPAFVAMCESGDLDLDDRRAKAVAQTQAERDAEMEAEVARRVEARMAELTAPSAKPNK